MFCLKCGRFARNQASSPQPSPPEEERELTCELRVFHNGMPRQDSPSPPLEERVGERRRIPYAEIEMARRFVFLQQRNFNLSFARASVFHAGRFDACPGVPTSIPS
jgi:hypothetical protein